MWNKRTCSHVLSINLQNSSFIWALSVHCQCNCNVIIFLTLIRSLSHSLYNCIASGSIAYTNLIMNDKWYELSECIKLVYWRLECITHTIQNESLSYNSRDFWRLQTSETDNQMERTYDCNRWNIGGVCLEPPKVARTLHSSATAKRISTYLELGYEPKYNTP